MKTIEETPFYGINDPWDALIFKALTKVNACLHSAEMPEAASRRLEDMQACICSGDGRTRETAFRASSAWVREKVLSLLDAEGSVSKEESQENYTRVILNGDYAPIGAVWFKTNGRA